MKSQCNFLCGQEKKRPPELLEKLLKPKTPKPEHKECSGCRDIEQFESPVLHFGIESQLLKRVGVACVSHARVMVMRSGGGDGTLQELSGTAAPLLQTSR